MRARSTPGDYPQAKTCSSLAPPSDTTPTSGEHAPSGTCEIQRGGPSRPRKIPMSELEQRLAKSPRQKRSAEIPLGSRTIRTLP
jgi:hypothetical protein